METMTHQTTADKLAAMMTENCGVSLLDSGGTSGRKWQRNQEMTTEDFLKLPLGHIDYEYQTLTISGFHYALKHLDNTENCEYLDKRFRDWVEAGDDRYYNDYETLEEFLEETYHIKTDILNSYNWENLLDEVFQFAQFELGDEQYIALSWHGGMDVRGGYSDFRFFRACSESCAFGMTALNATLQCPNCGTYGDTRDSGFHLDWYDQDGNEFDSSDWDLTKGCPTCAARELQVFPEEFHYD